MAKFGVIIAAAGASTRFGGDEKKQFEDLAGRAVFIRALEPFLARADVGGLVLAVAAEDLERVKTRWGSHLGFHGVKLTGVPPARPTPASSGPAASAGGGERIDSVAAAFELLPPDCDFVAIHDAARPLVDPDLIERVFAKAAAGGKSGAAICAVPLTATLKQVDESRRVVATPPRRDLWLAQTPQVFARGLYADALAKRGELKDPITDDAQLVESAGHAVVVVPGRADNFKITTAEDLAMARQLLKARGVRGRPEPPKHHRF